VRKTVSEAHGTQKFLWGLEDGLKIESVYIPEADRKTVCISSQVGCALGCTFCATGRMGFKRNLSPHEIVDQVLSVRRETLVQPTNVVVMGMGEPLLNYDHVMRALGVLNDPEGLAIAHRRITVSTAGIVPRIRQMAEEGRPYKLAVSLNAARDDLRGVLMPVNKKYPMDEVIKVVKYYTAKTKKRVTFEYVLLKGVNDSIAEADRLLRLLKGLPCKVNLIAFNETGGTFERPDTGSIHAFAERIKPLRAPVILRLSRGDDIAAACGQLAAS
jgi:23S rRNA (adenine2503-C2)-methyltransferase